MRLHNNRFSSNLTVSVEAQGIILFYSIILSFLFCENRCCSKINLPFFVFIVNIFSHIGLHMYAVLCYDHFLLPQVKHFNLNDYCVFITENQIFRMIFIASNRGFLIQPSSVRRRLSNMVFCLNLKRWSDTTTVAQQLKYFISIYNRKCKIERRSTWMQRSHRFVSTQKRRRLNKWPKILNYHRFYRENESNRLFFFFLFP